MRARDLSPYSRIISRMLVWKKGQVEWQALNEQEWRHLILMAEAEGVAPLLYRRLQIIDSPLPIPATVLAALQRIYYHTVARQQVFENELRRVDQVLKQAGIRYTPLKGAALAWTIYPEAALRPMSDLDLLVAPDDLRRAIQVLNRAGFFTQKVTDHAVLTGNRPNESTIELHWTFPGGVPIPTLDFRPETHLIYLAAHQSLKHAGHERLIWLYDIYLLLERWRDKLDWAALWAQADSMGYTPALWRALSLVAERFESALPGLPFRIDPTTQGQAMTRPIPVAQEIRRAWRELGIFTRLRLLPNLLFPSPGYIQWKYRPRPGWLWPVFYFWRMVHVIGDTLAQVAR